MAAQTALEPQTRPGLSTSQLIERFVLFVALIGLILTGLPQRYTTEWWANILFVLGGGVESLRILHRIFAALLLAEAIYHVLAVLYSRFVIGQGLVMLPGMGDFRALLSRVLSNFGGNSASAPSYQFILKFEYLLVSLSVLVLGITGIILWNPIAATKALPGAAIPVARSVHSDHAMLFIVALVLLRIGIALLWRPNRAEIFADQPAPALSDAILRARRQRFMPVLVVVAVVLAGGLLWYLTSEQTAINTVPRRESVIFAPQALPEMGDPHIGEVLWGTLRCAFCHGANGEGGTRDEPAIRGATVSFAAFFEQVRVGQGEMPSFSSSELPDGYLVHLWAWLTQPQSP